MSAPTSTTGERICLTVLAAACLAALAVVAVANRCKPFIGTPDEAAYAHQADRLLAGDGFTVSYVQHFFRASDDIEHAEDHYGVGNGVLIAAAFGVLGRSEWTATVPTLALGLLALPLLTYAAARRCGAGPWPAVGAGLFVLLCRPLLGLAHYALVDSQFTACAVAAWVIAAGLEPTGRHRATAPVAAGALLGLAYYLKPAAFLLVPGLVATVLLGGERSPARKRLWGIAALLCAFGLVIAPWLVRNAVVFGDPLYSANQYIGPGEDYRADWVRSDFRRVWWAHEREPLVTTPRLVATYGWSRAADVALGRLSRGVGGDARNPFIVLGASIALLWRCRRLLSLGALVGSYTLLLGLLFPVHDRYLILVWPAAAAAGAAVVGAAIPALSHLHLGNGLKPIVSGAAGWRPWRTHSSRLAGAMHRAPTAPLRRGRGAGGEGLRAALSAAIPIGLALALSLPGLRLLRSEVRYHLSDGDAIGISADEIATRRAAEWLGAALPVEARVMVQDCWRTVYYAPQPVVNIPTDGPREVAAVIDRYRLDYIMLVPGGTYSRMIPYARAYLSEYPAEWRLASATPGGVELWERGQSLAREDRDER